MSWETITNMKPASSAPPKVPHDGVAVSARAVTLRKALTKARYVRIQIGAGLAKKLCLIGEQSRLRLALGGGKYAGFVALSVDVSTGAFPARRTKDGGYVLTINEASAAGLFALEFVAFTAIAEPVQPAPAGPPMLAFPGGVLLDGED